MTSHLLFNLGDIFGSTGIFGQAGFYVYLLPILLLFVVIYGILRTIKIFGKENKIDILVSLILALFITASTPFVVWFSGFIATYTGLISVLLIGLLLFFILMGMLGVTRDNMKPKDGTLKFLVFALVVIVAFWIFRQSGGLDRFDNIPDLNIAFGGIPIPTIAMLAILAGLIYLVHWAIFAKDKSETGTTTSEPT